MKILVDLLALSYGGSSTYAAEVLPRLAERIDFEVLLGRGRGQGLRRQLGDSIPVLEAPGWTRNPLLRHLYQRHRLPELARRRAADVVFVAAGLTGLRPRGGRPKLVVTLHNMLPFLERERCRYSLWRNPYMRWRLRMLGPGLLRTFRGADRVLYISHFSAQVVEPRVGHRRSRVIPHGVSDAWRTGEPLPEAQREELGVGSRYFVYVSGFEPYKHQDKLLDGFRLFRRRTGDDEHRLVLAGPSFGSYGRRIAQRLRDEENVVWLGAVEQRSLPALLRGARGLLFASTCETCPNVLLEYLGAGRPVLCSDAPPMPEIGGDAVVYVDALDPEAWGTALAELVEEPESFAALGERARERATRYSWDRTARETFRALSEW